MESTEHTPTVAVVILNWNGRSFLETYLPSVMDTDYGNLSVIVADNGSDDDSLEFLQKNFPLVRIVQLDKNYGFAEGYNRALEQVEADYFVLLNSDVRVTHGWVSPVVRLMESDSQIAACQPKILSDRQNHLFEYAGAAGGWLDRYGYPFCRGRVFDHCEEDNGQYNDATEVFWATGACLFVRPEAFRKAGGFDPSFFAHQEEIDLCWRLKNEGYKIYVEPASKVYHLGGGTLAAGNYKKVFLNFRNNLFMLYKNLNRKKRLKTIFIRLTLDSVAGLQFLSQGKFRSLFSVIRAHFAFYGMVLKDKKRGSAVKKKKDELVGMYDGSIVWRYFVQKQKTFSKIVDNKN